MEQGRTYPNQSDQVNELFEALSKAQAEIESASKARQGYNYQYADLNDTWDVAREPLTKNGLCVVQHPIVMNGVMVLQTTLGHKSGQWIRSELVLDPADSKPQTLGSMLTYYRRYALSAIVGVCADKDDDGEAAQVAASKNESMNDAQKISPAQLTNIKNLLSGDETIASKILKDIRLKSFADLPVHGYDFVIRKIQKYLDDKRAS